MKFKLLFIFFIFSFSASHSNSQELDSMSKKTTIKRSIIPSAFIVSGIIISGSQFEKNVKTNLRDKVGNDFYFTIENYIMFTPVVEMYGADLCGVKSRNHWFDQTKYLAISNLLSSGIVNGIKYLVNKTRPNGGSYSFPSGHTTFAFTNATVLFNEFNQTSPFLAYSGYAFAATTGTFRMLNNKHWLSDVLFGAGLGILVTNLVYYYEPLKNFNPFKKSRNISFFPQMDDEQFGFYFAYRF